MPRICPMQLLNCLSVLLSPYGGIKSRDEVQRLASLMTKFSKKLVSKCIYIQILKCTETELLGLFMGSGGWRLVHMWLTESIVAKNWPLVRELLELLLLCPVDIERLKTNNCPKLVKELSKDGNHYAIRALASKLVEQWLKTVKGEHVGPILLSDIIYIIDEQTEPEPEVISYIKPEPEEYQNHIDITDDDVKRENSPVQLSNQVEKDNDDTSTDIEKETSETLPVLKITLKNGKQVISQVEDSDSRTSDEISDKDKIRDKHKSKTKEKSSERSSSSSRSSSSKHSSKSLSSSDKHKSSHKSSSSKHSSREKTKDKEKQNSSHSSKSKHNTSSSSSRKSSSSSSRSKDEKSKHSSEKEKSKEKEKDDRGKDSPKPSLDKSEEKQQSPSIHKLGKIPKLSDLKKEKPSISIEVRKPDEPKPKTVKTYNSKFRKHGLEEEVKPPPSRATLLNKKPPPVLPSSIPMPVPKRTSPVHNEAPPEKKLKHMDVVEKPGAIKLIPPKPKRKEGPQWPSTRKFIYLGCCNSAMMLLESDMFMDALNASATNKKEPKKRKRRTSGSRDGNAANESSPPHTPTTVSSPNSENKSVPPRFYQDTLDTEENKQTLPEKNNENSEEAATNKDPEDNKEEEMETSEPHTLTVNGLKGVLCYHKRKGPKKSIKWKPDSELEEIQYFELDETERVNVTKTFTDMKYLERIHEREAFQKGRNLSNDDVMEEKTSWKPLISIDLDGQIQVDYGKNSKEKDTQAIRQKATLQPLYFHKSMIPDSAHEPDIETHTYTEPTVIPLDDVTGNQDNISDFRNMPWPEPKGVAPPTTTPIVPTMFPPNMPQFPPNFPVAQFPGVVPPVFQSSPLVPGDWPNGVPPHMMPNGIPGPMPPTGLPPGPVPPGTIPPGMMVPPENMIMGPDMFGAPNPMFPVPPEGFNMQQNMFPMDFNMSGPPGPPGLDGFTAPGGNFRGAMRGRGAGGHWRGKSGGNWEGPTRGRGGHARGSRKVMCIYFQRKGSCRQGENCSFLHPGVNCPF